MMIGDKSLESRFIFHIKTPITVAREAFYTTATILKEAGIHKPYWILPEEIVQQRTMKRIMSHVFGQSYLSDNESIIIAKQDFSEETITHHTHAYRKQMSDGMIICGDEATVRFGKLIAYNVSQTAQNQDNQRNPIVLIPVGELDGSEYLGSVTAEFHAGEETSLIPVHAIVDGRISRLTTPISIARSMCYALLRVCTAVLEDANDMMMSLVEVAFSHAHLALELTVDSVKHSEAWIDGTLAAAVVIHAGGTCAQNQKNNAIISFSDRLAIPGIADRFQSAAALLPYVCMRIQRNHPDIYNLIKEKIQDMDPIEFTRAWIALTDSCGTELVIQHLCGDMHDLLTHPRNIRDLQPILSLFPSRGGRK